MNITDKQKEAIRKLLIFAETLQGECERRKCSGGREIVGTVACTHLMSPETMDAMEVVDGLFC